MVPLWLIFYTCTLAETRRTPFDLTEGESELVSRYNVEYSRMLFAFLFLAEYSFILVMGFLSVALYWGGSTRPGAIVVKITL